MNVFRTMATLVTAGALVACSGGGDDENHVVSTGLKIFATADVHVGDFAGDPTLAGTTAIQKADAFCNRSASKPDGNTYKALLVDGVDRDAVALVDWVLLPNTTYFQSYGDVPIDTTSAAAIFSAYYLAMQNPVSSCGSACAGSQGPQVWTGIANAGNFATSNTRNCGRWGAVGSTSGQAGARGLWTEKDGDAFSAAGDYGCDPTTGFALSLYCVEQP
jgi:hypothetical protein